VALASAAQTMPFSLAYQPDGTITQARMGSHAPGFRAFLVNYHSGTLESRDAGDN
jgi:hypothetical protein